MQNTAGLLASCTLIFPPRGSSRLFSLFFPSLHQPRSTGSFAPRELLSPFLAMPHIRIHLCFPHIRSKIYNLPAVIPEAKPTDVHRFSPSVYSVGSCYSCCPLSFTWPSISCSQPQASSPHLVPSSQGHQEHLLTHLPFSVVTTAPLFAEDTCMFFPPNIYLTASNFSSHTNRVF